MIETIEWQDVSAVEKIKNAIKKGNLVAGTSDTVPGLLASLTQEGQDALNRAKQRRDMPYLVLAHSSDQIASLTDAINHEPIASLAAEFWPGPLTLILPAKKEAPAYAQSASGGIAVRIPAHDGLLKLLAQTGPLFSTSANRSGHPVPTTLAELDPEIKAQVALLVKDDDQKEKMPSTILDCTGEGIKIMREGAISQRRLQNYLR